MVVSAFTIKIDDYLMVDGRFLKIFNREYIENSL